MHDALKHLHNIFRTRHFQIFCTVGELSEKKKNTNVYKGEITQYLWESQGSLLKGYKLKGKQLQENCFFFISFFFFKRSISKWESELQHLLLLDHVSL